MARGIGDDETATLRGKEPVGDVDRNALLGLRLQAVDQKREIEIATGGAGDLALGRPAPSAGRRAAVFES
jgi:hypothetical protein